MEEIIEHKMLSARKGEPEKPRFRSERIMVMSGRYYFLTRERTQEGPFLSREEAEIELNLYVKDMCLANGDNSRLS